MLLHAWQCQGGTHHPSREVCCLRAALTQNRTLAILLCLQSSLEADSHGEDPSSPQDGTDARPTFGPQNMSLEERKKHRAEVARRAKAAKGVRPLSTPWADPAHAAAVDSMLHSATLASREVRAKTWKVKPDWLRSMINVLAKIL